MPRVTRRAGRHTFRKSSRRTSFSRRNEMISAGGFMKIRSFVSLVLAAFACQALALQATEAAAPAAGPTLPSRHEPSPETIVVPAGTNLVLVFESTVSSVSAQPEDVVLAHLG